MPAIDVKGPSEEESFDVTTDNAAPVATEPPVEATAAPATDEKAADLGANETVQPTVAAPPKAARRLPLPNFRTIVEAVLVLLVVVLALWSWSLASDKNNLKKQVDQLNANPQAIIQKQTDDLISRVSALMQLPSGETPTVANVSDAAKAKQQSAFFANAQNGDKVLMYVKAGEAILYRPSTNKIILVAPLTFANNTSATSGTPSAATKR